MRKRTFEILEGIILIVVTIGIIIYITFLILEQMNYQIKDYEKSCFRMSMNEFEDNCMCPCDEPNWIEQKLGLGTLCDGWIVKKNQSCWRGDFAG